MISRKIRGQELHSKTFLLKAFIEKIVYFCVLNKCKKIDILFENSIQRPPQKVSKKEDFCNLKVEVLSSYH